MVRSDLDYSNAELTLGCLDVQYATVIAILFVTYCPAQIPSNMV